ncbi:hypothetical protein AB0J38_14610 [Streptomyces sp. NPDC050095]|uniref:hypothetical protein n=1 Tax=unclassified Streptomyces TaxID=2593676 RepID=UPI003424110C
MITPQQIVDALRCLGIEPAGDVRFDEDDLPMLLGMFSTVVEREMCLALTTVGRNPHDVGAWHADVASAIFRVLSAPFTELDDDALVIEAGVEFTRLVAARATRTSEEMAMLLPPSPAARLAVMAQRMAAIATLQAQIANGDPASEHRPSAARIREQTRTVKQHLDEHYTVLLAVLDQAVCAEGQRGVPD